MALRGIYKNPGIVDNPVVEDAPNAMNPDIRIESNHVACSQNKEKSLNFSNKKSNLCILHLPDLFANSSCVVFSNAFN